MVDENRPTWRDGVSERLGAIEQGVKDLGKNFDALVKELKGNGRPGILDRFDRRIQALEDAVKRGSWVGALWSIARTAASVIAAAIILGLLRHYFHWL